MRRLLFCWTLLLAIGCGSDSEPQKTPPGEASVIIVSVDTLRSGCEDSMVTTGAAK